MNAGGVLNTCKSNVVYYMADGGVTREQSAHVWGITVGNDR